jgi:hypothetical protein
MFTHYYKGAYIHGYFDREECHVSCNGIPNTKQFKSYRAAQSAITKALKSII